MQIRCAHCTKTLALGHDGALPGSCPHCAGRPGPGALGPYEPQRLLAAGGMGEVYLARHHELGTEVALKVLPAMPLDQLAALRQRFAREARLTAQVKHPGVVQVLASDVDGDRPYLVLELVRGQTLRQRLLQGALPLADAARIAAATAEVLSAAHAEGVFHRDIKPDNVMLEPDGSVRVLDFGIARAVQDDAPITRTGEILGTPEYMAPEQLLFGPEAIDARTDVHALGVLSYELITGRSPFHGANVFQALKLVEALVPPPPSKLRAEVPHRLDLVVLRALAKQPDDRFASAMAFAHAMRDAVPDRRQTPARGTSPWLWCFWLPLAVAALLLAAAMLILTTQMGPIVDVAMPALSGTSVQAAWRELDRAQQAMDQGRWCDVLAHGARTLDSPFADPGLAQRAFVLHHLAWPLAAGLPAWLARTDERQRTRLFGCALEPEPTADAELLATRALLALDTTASLAADDEQLRWLQLALTDDPQLARQLAAATAADDALARLLRLRQAPLEQRADGFADYAQRLPIECAEHWLARTIERHLRGDAQGGTHAAENAWLAGAGELAVLLDAALQMLQRDAGRTQLITLPATTSRRLSNRLAAADPQDAPATALLGLPLQAMATADLTVARQFPPASKRFAAAWFVAVAEATPPPSAPGLLLVAIALGAQPDYAADPWRALLPASRELLDAELRRGR